MSVQDGSPASPTPPPKNGPKQSIAERKNRRVFVENLLIDGHREGRIVVDVAQRYGISTRMVRKDLRMIRLRWAREDNAYLDEQRKRQVKALERIARKAEAAGDLAQARMSRRDVARLLGMGNKLEVSVGVRGRIVHEHVPADPEGWTRELAGVWAELGMLLPGASALPAVVTVPAEVRPAAGS